MPITTSELRGNIYRLLDQILETGWRPRPCSIPGRETLSIQ